MKQILLFIMVYFSYGLANAQGSRFQFEPFIGGQHVHHHQCSLEDKTIHRGYTLSTGFRLIFDLTERISVVSAYTLHNMAGDNFKFPLQRKVNLNIKFELGHFEWLERLTFTGECGITYVLDQDAVQFPFFFGTQFKITHALDWNLRLRPPSLRFLTDNYGSLPYVEYAFETGISLRICSNPAPKFEGRVGNPFILQ